MFLLRVLYKVAEYPEFIDAAYRFQGRLTACFALCLHR